MKKTITIIAYNRPNEFKRMLKSLVKNNLEGWDILVGLEPSNMIHQQLDLLEEFIPQANIFKRTWEVNNHRTGIARNSHDIIVKAFESGSDYNIYLEEDLVVSPDITNLADWYYELEEDTLCLCLCNIGRVYQDLNNSNAAIIYPSPECTFCGQGTGFSSLGIVMKKDKFLNEMSPHWFHEQGWDWGVLYHIKETQQKVLIPYQTRTDHIGVFGTHVSGHRHQKKLKLGFLDVCQESIEKDDFYLSKGFYPSDVDPRKEYLYWVEDND